MAPTAPLGPLANASTSNLAYNISNYLFTNFGAFIEKCTIRPKKAAYPLHCTEYPLVCYLFISVNTIIDTFLFRNNIVIYYILCIYNIYTMYIVYTGCPRVSIPKVNFHNFGSTLSISIL